MHRYKNYLGPDAIRLSKSSSHGNGSRTPRNLKSYSGVLQRNQRSSPTSVRHDGTRRSSESSDNVSRVTKSTITRSSRREEFNPNAVNPTYAFSDDEEIYSIVLEANVQNQGLTTAAALPRARNICTSPLPSVEARSLAKPVKSPPQSQTTPSSKFALPSIPRTPALPGLKTRKSKCNQNPDLNDWDELSWYIESALG
jgi:hypothetical protein